MNIPWQTIHSFLSRYDQREIPDNLARPGRPQKPSASDVRYLVRTAESNTDVPLKEISVNAFSDVSTRTLHRQLLEEGIQKWRAAERTLLTKERATKHLKWARAHQHWTRDDWAKIVWSDEWLLRQDSDPRKLWVFRRQNKREKFAPKNIRGKLDHGGVSVMVWACFCNDKLGPLTFIDGNMNSHVYTSILGTKLIPFIEALQQDSHSDIQFQQDNSGVHKSKLTTTWLNNLSEQHGFPTIEWPPYSPDMNPIEELWAHLKTELHRRYPDITSLQGSQTTIRKKIQDCLWEVWWDISEEVLNGLIGSMPHRVHALISARGWYTKY